MFSEIVCFLMGNFAVAARLVGKAKGPPRGLWPALKFARRCVRSASPLVMEMSQRKTAVPKSATAGARQPPGPQQHYDSLAVDPNRPLLTSEHHLVIVDDVVNRQVSRIDAFCNATPCTYDVRLRCCSALRKTNPSNCLFRSGRNGV